MRLVSPSLLFVLLAATLSAPLHAQQVPGAFRWIDFHSVQASDQDVVVWVRRTLDPEKWTAIREIGVQYDAALVITTLRANPQALPASDTFTVWSLSLTNHSLTPLLKGVNLRLPAWMLFGDGAQQELGALYDDCDECAATTYFTAFHYDFSQHMWAARWMRGSQAVPLWSGNPPGGVALTQVYAILSEPNGVQMMATWNHFDYGDLKPAEDAVYRYDLDPWSGLERTQLLRGKVAEAMEQRICGAQGAVPSLARGQDSALCKLTLKTIPERKPIARPPAGNHGRATPPGARR